MTACSTIFSYNFMLVKKYLIRGESGVVEVNPSPSPDAKYKREGFRNLLKRLILVVLAL